MKRFTKQIFLLFLTVALMLGNAGVHAALAFSVGEEKEVGEELLTMVRKGFKLIDEPDVIQYINELGAKTLAVAGSQFFDYHFFVISNKELNAFAAPSGLIFFHSGLIETLESEEELVGVVAHEIGHVVSRHLADRISKNTKVSAAAMLGVLVGIAIGAGPLSEAIITGSAAAAHSAALSFSRLDEEEADRLAFKWMQEQNLDPGAMVNMLRTIHTINRYRMGYVPPYLLTHPGPDVRMSYIQDLIIFSEKKEIAAVDPFPFQRFKGRVVSLSKEPGQLIAYYQDRVATMPPGSRDSAMAHYGMSQAYLAAADYSSAEKSLRRTMEFFPDKTMLKADLAVISLKAGMYDRAIELLREIRRIEPANGYANFYLAQALEKKGELADAAGLYEEVLVMMPDYAKLYYRLANVKAQSGAEGEGFYYYGYYYWYEGDLLNSRRQFSRALSLLPEESRQRAEAQAMLQKITRLEKEK
ncbi:MAG: M48 family metalloprotease [Deltaproteobacteria bacterium]|jgi:predicted Zn-dependent protease|nr:M48 family metalloprotease [Deltaproteobacteria bacterium]